MKPSSANMGGSKAVNKPIRNFIVKMSNWGCSQRGAPEAIHTLHDIHRHTGGALRLSAKRGFDTSQLAAGNSFTRKASVILHF